MLMGSFGALAQEVGKSFGMPPGMGPMGGPQLSPTMPQTLPGATTLPPSLNTNTNIPGTAPAVQPGAPAMPANDAHAPRCWCTAPNPVDQTRMRTKCEEECCAEAGAESCH